MKLPRTQISNMVAGRILKDGASKKFVNEVAAYLLMERRVNDLDSILRDIQSAWAEAGYVEVLATSAFPLDVSAKTDIQKRIKQYFPQAKRVIITEIRDADAIGGVRLSLANQQLDFTIETKLNKFKHLTTVGKDY